MTDDHASASTAPAAPGRVSLLWALQEHAAEIAQLHGAIFDEAWDAAAVSRLLAHPGSIALVARQGVPPVLGGFALAQVAADEAEILTFGVTESWRRHGVGSQLVAGLMRAAARAGARSLFLEVAAGNEAARHLYAKAGFAEAGRRAGYYVRPGGASEDALVLKVALEPAAMR